MTQQDIIETIRTAAKRYGHQIIDAEDMRRIESELDPLRELMQVMDGAVAPGSESCLATPAWSVYDDPEHIEWWVRAYAALYAAQHSDPAAPEQVCERLLDGDLEGAEEIAGASL